MNVLNQQAGFILLFVFAAVMIFITSFASRGKIWHTASGFMAAGRNVPWWLGAISIAVTWIWAPALFVSTQQAYQQGIPGLFWFVFPNMLSLMVIAPLAVKIRDLLPAGYTQPEWIEKRFDKGTRNLFLVPFFWYQVMAVTVQLYAGGNIFSLLTGVPLFAVMTVLAATTLIYSLISGMRASIVTDFLQYGLILIAIIVIVPWTISAAGGAQAILGGIGGVTGEHKSLFDAQVAFNFGIVTSIGLISGSLSDQQHWQRAFAIKKSGLIRAYIVAGLLFGIVPIAIALLGFIGANPAFGISLPAGVDASMIGVAVVRHFLPAWAVIAFLVMMLGGLCATLDSGMCAAGALYAMNCTRYSYEEMQVHEKDARGEPLTVAEETIKGILDQKIIQRGRLAMVGVTLIGFLIAALVVEIPSFGLKYLWWVFNTIAACVAAPIVLSFYWKRVTSLGVKVGVTIALVGGIPLFVYSNLNDMIGLTVASSVGIVAVTVLSMLVFQSKEQHPI